MISKLFALLAFPIWLIAAFLSFFSFELSVSLRGLSGALIVSSLISGLFFFMFSWRSYSSFVSIIGRENASPKVFLPLVIVLIGGLSALSYQSRNKELPKAAVIGRCTFVSRAAFFNQDLQGSIRTLLNQSRSYVAAAVHGLESLCEISEDRLFQKGQGKETAESDRGQLLRELIGIDKMVEVYEKRLEAALAGENPEQITFDYQKDVLSNLKAQHVDDLLVDLEKLSGTVSNLGQEGKGLGSETLAEIKKNFQLLQEKIQEQLDQQQKGSGN